MCMCSCCSLSASGVMLNHRNGLKPRTIRCPSPRWHAARCQATARTNNLAHADVHNPLPTNTLWRAWQPQELFTVNIFCSSATQPGLLSCKRSTISSDPPSAELIREVLLSGSCDQCCETRVDVHVETMIQLRTSITFPRHLSYLEG